MIALARDVREANVRSDALGLSDDELAFYDALGVNGSAVQVLGDETLRDIAHELVETVRGNVTMDWTLRENVRANLRRFVKRILRKHGYPPDGVARGVCDADHDAVQAALYEQIGRLKVELDWLKRKHELVDR